LEEQVLGRKGVGIEEAERGKGHMV